MTAMFMLVIVACIGFAMAADIPMDLSRSCSVGGAFGLFQSESGCGIGNCQCFPVLFKCDPALGNGLGQCRLSLIGALLLVLAAMITVIVPVYFVVQHIYNDTGKNNHDAAIIQKEISTRRIVLTKQMTKELQEQLDMDSVPSTDETEMYFDMRQFRKTVPSKTIGVDRKPKIKLEAMGKAWIYVMFIFLLLSTAISLVIFMVPAAVSTEQTPLALENIQPLNQTAFAIDATVRLAPPRGTRFLSVAGGLCELISPTEPGLTLLNASYDMSFSVDNEKFFNSYIGYALIQCDCTSSSCFLSSNYATSTFPLVFAPWYFDQFRPFSAPAERDFTYHVALDLHVAPRSLDFISLSLVSHYSRVYMIVDGTKLAFMVGDVLLLIFWTWINRKVEWKHMLPERRLLFVLLICNFLGSGPVMHVLTIFFSDSVSYLFSQSWTVTMNAAWLLVFFVLIDYQRRVSLVFSYGAIPIAAAAVTLRHISFYLYPASVTSLVDLCLSVVSLWLFRADAMSVRNTLRRRPYAATRQEQLTARVLYIISYCVPYVYFFAALAADPLPVVHSYIGTTKTLTNLPTQIILRASTLVLVLAFLPPSKRDRNAAAECIYTTRDAAPSTSKHFSIETACSMYNLSCHAYYAAPGFKNEPSDSDMDVTALGRDDIEVITAIYDQTTDTHGVVFADDTRLILAFRGTYSTKNAYTDLAYNFVSPNDDAAWAAPDVRVHAGFWTAYLSVRDQVIGAVKEHCAGREIFCTGHSLGGALATIAAVDVAATIWRPVTMYNYGSPRVGNHAFAREFNSFVEVAFRVVNDGDVIVGGPKRAILCLYCVSSLRYKHVGKAVLLSERANGTFIVDPNLVEMAFMAQLRGNGFSHFLGAYKVRLLKGLQATATERTPLLNHTVV
ncbi:hypothetical protein AeMF1_009256 [Aphanomyces euteiches]|nr:hypothetical protein AeMF1_009256 [Aphanomyces euteiches]KAH9131579.1 hypothetical protein AeNC1_019564 [Aphanomyces euteiches]